MNLFTTNPNQLVSELNPQLAEFGLCPTDWQLIPDSDDNFKIQNKDESSFYFLGSTQKVKGKNIWKHIQLASF